MLRARPMMLNYHYHTIRISLLSLRVPHGMFSYDASTSIFHELVEQHFVQGCCKMRRYNTMAVRLSDITA